MDEYCNNLEKGKIFFHKEYGGGSFGESKIIDYYYDDAKQIIYVACDSTNPVKPYYLEQITIVDGQYAYNGRSLFSPVSVEKYMTIARGKEWNGEDTIDDYC